MSKISSRAIRLILSCSILANPVFSQGLLNLSASDLNRSVPPSSFAFETQAFVSATIWVLHAFNAMGHTVRHAVRPPADAPPALGMLSNGDAARSFNLVQGLFYWLEHHLKSAVMQNDEEMIETLQRLIKKSEQLMRLFVKKTARDEEFLLKPFLNLLRDLIASRTSIKSMRIALEESIPRFEEVSLEEHRKTQDGKPTGKALVGRNWEDWDEDRHGPPLRELFRSIAEEMVNGFVQIAWLLGPNLLVERVDDVIHIISEIGVRQHARVNLENYDAGRIVGMAIRKTPSATFKDVRNFVAEITPILQDFLSVLYPGSYPSICDIAAFLMYRIIRSNFGRGLQLDYVEGEEQGIGHFWLELEMEATRYFASFSEGQFHLTSKLKKLNRSAQTKKEFIDAYRAKQLDYFVLRKMGDDLESFYRNHSLSVLYKGTPELTDRDNQILRMFKLVLRTHNLLLVLLFIGTTGLSGIRPLSNRPLLTAA